MNRLSIYIFFFVVVGLYLIGFIYTDFGSRVAAAPADQPLLQSNNLTYLGAFSLPKGGTGASDGFNYGVRGVAYNPAKNSLFLNSADNKTAEVKIPQTFGTSLTSLPVGTFLQNFYDASEGKLTHIGANGAPCCVNGDYIGGLMVYGEKLIGTSYAYYDGGYEARRSHFTSGLNFTTNGDVGGMYQVGSGLNSGFYAGYMTQIPAEWQSSFGGPALTGQCCIPIISRTSLGPSAFVFDPNDLGVKTPVPATPLLYYTGTHPTLGTWDNITAPNLYFNMATMVTGVVFPTGTSTVLFFGKQGTGTPCYGQGGSVDPHDNHPFCYDPADGEKGNHSYPYKYWVWAYDARDLVAVKNGEKQPWDVKPYTIWELPIPWDWPSADIQGAAYDSATQRIYISQAYASRFLPGTDSSDKAPLIQVFQVNNASPVVAPIPTSAPISTPTFTSTPTSTPSTTPTPLPSTTPIPSYTPVPTPTPTPYSFFIPTPLPLSSRTKLIRAINTQQVYYITETNLKRHIPNENIFLSYGNNWVDVAIVSQSQVDAISDVALIRSLPDKRVFKLENGFKRWITSPEVFNRNYFKWDQITPINTTELNYYPIGSDIN